MIGAAEQVEVVDVGRAEIGLDRLVDARDRNAELLRLDPIDVDEQLRRIRGERREHLREPGRLARRGNKFVVGGCQAFGAATLAILDAHGKAAAGADARHRGRRNDDNKRALKRRQPFAQIAGDHGRGQPLLQPHFRLLEHREQGRGIARLRSGGAREACECRDANDARRIERDSFNLTDHVGRARQRRRARQLHGDDDVAAILCGNETLRRRGEQPAGAADQRHIDQQHHRRMPDHEVGRIGIAVRQPVKTAIEVAGEFVPTARDEIPACRWPLFLMRLQDLRRQRRRKRQRTEEGNCGRDRDGDGELLKELAGDAAQERSGHEHRGQYQRDRNQRATDLLHGF